MTGRRPEWIPRRLRRKVQAIEQALAVNRPDRTHALDVLAKVGGFEIAGLVGVILGAAALKIPVVLDGFITGAAGPDRRRPVSLMVRDYLIAAHPQHRAGARLHPESSSNCGRCWNFGHAGRRGNRGCSRCRTSSRRRCAILGEMATFASAGVTETGA